MSVTPRVPKEWIDHTRPLPAVFADAFTTAVEGLDASRERLVARLRYGLDGGPGRTFREIGQGLGRSPARARQLHWRAVTSIALAPLGPDPTWSPPPAGLRRGGAAGHRGSGRSHRPPGPRAHAGLRRPGPPPRATAGQRPAADQAGRSGGAGG